MLGSNQQVVPLNLLDHTMVDQFRLHFEFKGSGNGMPEVHSMAGDGAMRESFWTNPIDRGWTMNNATYFQPLATIAGPELNSTITSPWMLANAPMYDAKLDGVVTYGQVQVRFHPDDAWMNVSLPYTPTTNQDSIGMQARVVGIPPADGNMSNYSVWNVESLHMDMFGGQHPALSLIHI